MEPSAGTAQALVRWHDNWQDALADAGMRMTLIRPQGPVTSVLLTLGFRERVARVLVRDNDRVETSCDGDPTTVPTIPSRFDANEQVVQHVGVLADWVLGAPAVNAAR